MMMQQRTGAATDHRAVTRQYAVATTTMLMLVVSVVLAMMGHVVFVAAGAEDSIATAAAVAVAVPACSFPNTSMVSFQSCPHFEGESMVSQMELCLPFLLDEETTPSADCCGSVSNVSSGLPACFCKVTFYPPRMVNITQQKRLASFCNVTTDLCQTCPQYLVNRTYTRPDWMDRPLWTARGGPRFHLGQYNKKKLLLYHLKLFFLVLFSKLMPFPISIAHHCKRLFLQLGPSYINLFSRICFSCPPVAASGRTSFQLLPSYKASYKLVQMSFDVLGLACNDLLLISCSCCSSSSLIFSPEMSTITDVLIVLFWQIGFLQLLKWQSTRQQPSGLQCCWL
jgi:hypothetical protein